MKVSLTEKELSTLVCALDDRIARINKKLGLNARNCKRMEEAMTLRNRLMTEGL